MSKVVLVLLVFGFGLSMASAEVLGENYFTRIHQVLQQSRLSLPSLTSSAEVAAERFLAGGCLWAAGRQEDFISEACGRAGGLMGIRSLGKQSPGAEDIVLYATAGPLKANDLEVIEAWRKLGVLVVAFSSAEGLFDGRCPVDTVANVIHLWVWTGEFVAACSRGGKMPVLYQSYGLPGGRERGKKYQGKRIHDDLTIKPILPGKLGKAYLDRIEAMLAELARNQQANINQAAQWWREVPKDSSVGLVIGHMFPRHFQDRRVETFCKFMVAPAWEDPNLIDEDNPAKFVLYVGYQSAPGRLVSQADSLGVQLVYSSVKSASPAEPGATVVYIDPGWPLTDGCIEVDGYDIAILPASGVIEAVLYWELLFERGE